MNLNVFRDYDMPDFRRIRSQMRELVMPFGYMGGMGGYGGRSGGMDALMPPDFPDANTVMENLMGGVGMNMNNANCHSFSQSTVMTMSSGPDGQPQIYQESQSTRTAPGGVKETKKAVCDSRTGTKRLAVGRHIGERAHVRERVDNIQSGEREETEDYINLEEDDADRFNQEWREKARNLAARPGLARVRLAINFGDRPERSDRRPRALPAILPGRSRTRPSGSAVSSRRYERYNVPAITNSSANITEVTDNDDGDVVAERPRKRQREQITITDVSDDVAPPAPATTVKKTAKRSGRKHAPR